MFAKRSRPSVPAPGALTVHVIGVPSAWVSVSTPGPPSTVPPMPDRPT